MSKHHSLSNHKVGLPLFRVLCSLSPPERRIRPNPLNLVSPNLYQAGSSSQSVANMPRSASFGSLGERAPSRGLRKQRSGMHNGCFTTDWSVC